MREIYCVEKETKITRRSETQKRNLSVKVFRVRPTVANWLITTRYICEKGKNKKGARDLLPLLVFFRSIRRSQRWCHSLSHSLSLLGSPSFFCFSLSEFQLNGSWIAGHSWTWFISTGESDAIPENKTQKRKSFLAPSPSCSSFGMSDAPCIVSQTNIQWQKNSKYFSPKNSRNRHVRSQVSSLTDELVNEQNCQAKTGTAWTVGASLKKKTHTE